MDLAESKTPFRHSDPLRGVENVAKSQLFEGRFGRMFRRLPAFEPDDATIAAIAEAMAEPNGGDPSGDNDQIPAGFTFLGQFIDHDLTFDPVSSLDRQNDPDALTNFRTPRFDLDSVYGRGPADQPYLYDKTNRDKFLIGEHDNELDLPRSSQGVALIGDPRNDENIFISQLHLTLLLFHNRVFDRRADFAQAAPQAGETEFAAVQRVVRWHYQWLVVHDFLRRVVGEQTLGDVLVREPLTAGGPPVEKTRLTFFTWRNQPFMPVEFSVAAYRFAHSMIRGRYTVNSNVPSRPIFTSTPIAESDPLSHLGGLRPLPAGWQVEWRRFFEVDAANPPQPSRKIDTEIAGPLLALPPEVAPRMPSLAQRNLTRGVRLGLPSGQAVARALGQTPLTDDQLGLPKPGPAPLWYYLLREANQLAGGKHLGPVGGRIVAEVFLGLLAADPSSYLRADPGWTPFLPSATAGDFTMADLIKFTGFGLTPVA
ncbi:heme peroxidase family protein [Saccharothrix algeriensis]|uniref:Heme peroxidase n=2 Tax=Catellatospora bangladeshensis TaxID=310355 RepID=A0A8J3JTC0_9ACTN|nr:heme peroxidase [Catellatospora bangladeshensis]